MSQHGSEPDRRQFLGYLGAAAAATATVGPLPELRIGPPGDWDMSWVDRLASTKYKAVFDSPALSDGAALDLAADIWNAFTEIYGKDADARMVVVMRQLGQVMAFNDSLWEKYGIGQDRSVNDPVTKRPAIRNPFFTMGEGEPEWARDAKLDMLYKRGAIFLVCNRASMNWAAGAARRTNRPVDEVKADLRRNLVPGAILMPTGVFALVRAQNAGCAYMRGS